MDVFLHRSNKLCWQDKGFLQQSEWILLHLIRTGKVKLSILVKLRVGVQQVTFQWRAWEARTKLDTDSHCELNTHKCTLSCNNRAQDSVPCRHTLHKKGFGRKKIHIGTISCLSKVLQIIMTFSSVKYRIILHGLHWWGWSSRSSNGWLLNYS